MYKHMLGLAIFAALASCQNQVILATYKDGACDDYLDTYTMDVRTCTNVGTAGSVKLIDNESHCVPVPMTGPNCPGGGEAPVPGDCFTYGEGMPIESIQVQCPPP